MRKLFFGLVPITIARLAYIDLIEREPAPILGCLSFPSLRYPVPAITQHTIIREHMRHVLYPLGMSSPS